MADKGTAVAGVLAIAVAGGAAALLLSKKTTASGVTSLTLSASATNVAIGQDLTVTVMATDVNNVPVSGAKPILTENGVPATDGTFQPTSSDGTSTLTIAFAAAGSYVIQAEV